MTLTDAPIHAPYCHFEVCMSTDDVTSDEEIDQIRKRVARLVDDWEKRDETDFNE